MNHPTLLTAILLVLAMLAFAARLPAAEAGSAGAPDLPSSEQLPSIKELPDPFAFNDGSRVKGKDDWQRRRKEVLEAVLHYQYGQLPPHPGKVQATELLSHGFYTPLDATHKQFRLTMGPEGKTHSFLIDLLIPKGKGPFPVILRGDWGWGKLKDEIAIEVLKRGYIVADYNRVEVVPDNKSRETGLYLSYPEGDYGATAAWAWGFHRCVDFLVTQDYVDKAKITVTGHSRGGKAALLAGATDDRIALTVPNNSGCGGAGSYKFQAPKSEDAAAITKNFPFWFNARFLAFVKNQDKLPLDQHYVKAAIAPRALLTTEALDDLWANPEGTLHTHRAAKEVYKFLGAPDKLGIYYRPGKHEHNLADWQVMLDFADQVLSGKKSDRNFDPSPFPDTPKTFSWAAPAGQ